MKRIVILPVLLFAFSGIFSAALAEITEFAEVQKYYVGEHIFFGNPISNDAEVCHDFNGDGVGDLFFMKPYEEGDHVLYFTILLGDPSGAFPVKWDIGTYITSHEEPELLMPLVLDVNGDGRDDFLTMNSDASGSGYYVVHINDNPVFWLTEMRYIAPIYPFSEYSLNIPLAACDCDGDGLEDFMVGSHGCNEVYCQPVMVVPMTPSGTMALPTYLIDTSGFVAWSDAGTGDFNGDGITDFFERSMYSGVRIHAGDGDCGFYLFGGAGTVLSGYARIGNFNGDQYDDFIHTHEMMMTPDGYYAQVVLGGNEGVATGPSLTFPEGDGYFPIVVADANADGLDDVGVIDMWHSGASLPVYFHHSEGDAFGSSADTLLLMQTSDAFSNYNVFSWDFNIDGMDDLLYYVAPDTIGVRLQRYGPVPNFLQRFAVKLEGITAARVDWEVSYADGCESFTVSRSAGDGPFEDLFSVPADRYRESYSYLDDISDLRGSDLTYRLAATMEGGSRSILSERQIAVPRAELALHQNYPNPFNPGTVLPFTLPERAPVTIGIYDVTGKLVRRLLEGEELEAGVKEVYWNGINDAGQQVSSGIYYCRLTACKTTVTRKLVLLR